MTIPEWMAVPAEDAHDYETNIRAAKTRFLRKTVNQLRKALVEGLAAEEHARKTGIWQVLDPRAKLLSVLVLILATGLSSSVWELAFIGLGAGVAMAASRLPVLSLQKRIWGFIPLITLLLSLPAALNFFVDGTPWLVLARPGWSGTFWGIALPSEVFLTREGLLAVIRLGMRAGVSLSLAALLVLTTPAVEIFRTLRLLGLPAFLVAVLEMSYRYLALLVRLSLEMWEARWLRAAGPISLQRQQGMVASSVGVLFAKSTAFADEVYQAMRSRDYGGVPPASERDPFELRDWAWCGLSVFTLLAVLVL